MIINNILKMKKPNTDESLFEIFENEPRLVRTYDTFDCFLIEEDNHRKDAYYITRNMCLRNWLYGIMPDIMEDPLEINNQIISSNGGPKFPIYFPCAIASNSNNNLELCSFGLIDHRILNKIGCAKLVGWGALIELDNIAQVI
uniref:Uncharacterized protein n=1 Tax=Meloidogyne javanica TaxID=6303 RepID=A0A915LBU6_MELJA